MTDTQCPCEDCITLAICKGKDVLECPFLYTYIFDSIKYRGISNTKMEYRLKTLKSIFKKEIYKHRFGNLHKPKPEYIIWWTKEVDI